MEAKDVRNLKWVKLEETEEFKDWKGLPKWLTNDGKTYITNSYLTVYLEDVYKQIARKLNISVKELSKLIQEENSSFYTLKDQILKKAFPGVEENKGSWQLVKTYLMIPDVNSVPMIPKLDVEFNSKQVIEYILSLSKEEKKELTEHLKEFQDDRRKANVEKILEEFDQLPDIEKIEVLKKLELFQIKIELKPR